MLLGVHALARERMFDEVEAADASLRTSEFGVARRLDFNPT
jgi:hypothetical protein